MEYNWATRAFILQPNEVLETSEVRVTNLSKSPQSITFEGLSYFDRIKLSGGPSIDASSGLEFRLRSS